MSKQLEFSVRHATVADVPQIHSLIASFASNDEMLPRTMSELFDNVRDFMVAVYQDQVVGCAALHVVWEDLGEVKSVAVRSDMHKKGVGRILVARTLDESRELGLNRVFTLTYRPGFFSHFGFCTISRDMLPHKVWGECIKCRKFPNCNETAMMWHSDGSKPDYEVM